MSGGECPGVPGRLREPDQQQGDRGDRDLREVVGHHVDARNLGMGQAPWDGADEGDAMRPEVEQVGGEEPADDENQRTGDLGAEEAQREDRGERREPDQERGRVDIAETADPRSQLPPRGVAVGRGPGQLRQLADRHAEGGAREEAGHHRLGEELGDPAHPQQGEQEEQDPGDDRDPGDQLRSSLAAEAGDQHRPAGHRGERGARPGRDLSRGAEEGVDDRPGSRRVEPVLDRHFGDPGITEVLGHDHRGDRDARRQVPGQQPPLVSGQPARDREQPSPGSAGASRCSSGHRAEPGEGHPLTIGRS